MTFDKDLFGFVLLLVLFLLPIFYIFFDYFLSSKKDKPAIKKSNYINNSIGYLIELVEHCMLLRFYIQELDLLDKQNAEISPLILKDDKTYVSSEYIKVRKEYYLDELNINYQIFHSNYKIIREYIDDVFMKNILDSFEDKILNTIHNSKV